MASTPNQCDRLKVPMTVAPQTHARVLSPCRAFRRAHGQRRFSGWISGRWAGRCACGANGAALEHPSRFAEQRCGTSCQHRLIDDWPKQRRFDGGQPESGVQQRQARQYARRGWLGWQHPRHRLFALGVVLRDERFWGSGRKRRQLDGHAGAGERNDRQEGSKPCRKAALQHPASMRPAHPQAPRSSPTHDRCRPIAAPVGSSKGWCRPAKRSSHLSMMEGCHPALATRCRMGRPFDLRRCGTLEPILVH